MRVVVCVRECRLGGCDSEQEDVFEAVSVSVWLLTFMTVAYDNVGL